MIMKLVYETKIPNICICTIKPFIDLRYEYQTVKIKQIRGKFSFYLLFQMSQILKIDPILQLVGSKCKRVNSHRLLVSTNCHICAFLEFVILRAKNSE